MKFKNRVEALLLLQYFKIFICLFLLALKSEYTNRTLVCYMLRFDDVFFIIHIIAVEHKLNHYFVPKYKFQVSIDLQGQKQYVLLC